MSSNRRRGRSPGPPAAGKPSPAADTPPEAAVAERVTDAVAATTDASMASEDTAAEPVTEAALSAADAAATETAAIAEVAPEAAPETVQAAVAESVTDAVAEPAAEMTGTAVETVETVQAEAAASVAEAAEQAVESTERTVEAADAASEEAGALVAEAVERVAEAAPTLAAVPLAAAESVSGRGDAATGSRAGARLAFIPAIPAFEPLNEINATLIAFARGEGEAAVAHFQALTKVKTPAEAIRLQVSEFQRAADASLTCFSHILRSANRFSGPTRWN
jgi:hypothetical protein